MGKLRACVVAFATLLPAIAAAQLDGVPTAPGGRTAPMPPIDAGRERIAVVAASDLVGRRLRDPSGAAAGELRHLLIDALSGRIRYVLVGAVPGLTLADQLIALPWSDLSPAPRGEAFALKRSRAALAQAPRVHDVT